MAAYMFLAYTETEKGELELRETRTIETFITCLDMATESPYKRGKGYSVLELAKGIRILAQNDGNKRTLVQLGILPCLKKMLDSGKADEEEEALLTLWTLSFDEANKSQIKEEFGESVIRTQLRMKMRESREEQADQFTFAKRLEEESAFQDDEITEHAASIEVEEEEKEIVKVRSERKQISAMKALKGLIWQLSAADVKPVPLESEEVEQPSGGHLMISYNHQHKHVASQIAYRLRRNDIKVWIDLDDMASEDDIMEGMASAVENAFLICILYSKAYKDSPNTRSEAQYAYRMKKPLLFLRVQPGYQPDGWLGIMVGARLYIDFSGKYPFDMKFEELLKSINGTQEMHIHAQTQPSNTGQVNSQPTNIGSRRSSAVAEQNYQRWDERRTAVWLAESNVNWRGNTRLTGKHLSFLRQLEQQAPSFFYETLKSEGHLTELTSLMNFSNAVKQLPYI